MANVIKCDICGNEIPKFYVRYQLTEIGILGVKERDICGSCLSKIKTAIKMGQALEEEN